MIRVFLAALLLSIATPAPAADPQDLLGSWTVDLRPTPDAEPYYQEFTVASIEGREFTGRFYNTPIEEGRINADWGEVHFAFVTRDGSGVYHHSGRMVDGAIKGLSHSLGRGFLAVWSARRAE